MVIAIIAILAAILFPVFARARENARRASCQSNVKQILLGVLQYTQDYDEKYPIGHHDNGGSTQPLAQRGWYNILQPYLKSTQIMKCPSDSTPSTSFASYTDSFVPNGYVVSYIVNDFFGDGNGNPLISGSVGGISLSIVDSPATTVYMADGGKQTDGVTTTPPSPEKPAGLRMMYFADAVTNTANGDWAGPNPRHLETAVFGFADGHVKSGKVTSYYGAQNTPKGNCLNPLKGCQ